MSKSIDDPFETLGLTRDASAAEIRKRYKQLAVQHHPDRNSDPEAASMFKKVAAAYAILNDPVARERWIRDEANTVYEVPPTEHEPQVHQPPPQSKSRPISATERLRRAEFARQIAEELYGSAPLTRRTQRTLASVAPKILAGMILLYYLISFFVVESRSDLAPAPLVFVFWTAALAGLLLIWTPESGEELFLGQLPLSLVPILGWMLLLGVPCALRLLMMSNT